MSLDHSEFIARHIPGQKDPNAVKRRARRILLSLLFVIAYVLGCIVLAILLDINEKTMIASGSVFIVAAVLAFLFQKFLHNNARREKERLLLREVIEGSNGARIITDSADHAVYTNQLFDELCTEVGGKAGLETLARLFSDNKEAFNHFKNLAEHAQKGLRDSIELKSVFKDRERWFAVSAQPVAGWAGFVHWRIEDVTHQREFERWFACRLRHCGYLGVSLSKISS